MEQPTLTREQIERAARREGVYHPVISVLESYAPRLAQFNDGYSRAQDRQTFTRTNFGFLADVVEGVGDFSLGPLDIVAIWSKALEIIQPRYTFVGIVSSAYGISGVPTSGWKGLPRYWVERSELPNGVLRDKSGLLYVRSRFEEIGRSLSELNLYLYGTRESATRRAFELAQRIQAGDKEAAEEWEQIKAFDAEREKESTTPLLGEIRENFPNGLGPLGSRIYLALKELEKLDTK